MISKNIFFKRKISPENRRSIVALEFAKAKHENLLYRRFEVEFLSALQKAVFTEVGEYAQ